VLPVADYDRLFEELEKKGTYFTQKQNEQITKFKSKNFDLLKRQFNQPKQISGVPQRVRLAETVIQRRIGRILIVLDSSQIRDEIAALRSAECIGIQHVWIIVDEQSPEKSLKDLSSKGSITRGNHKYLSVRKFSSAQACIDALVAEGRELWVSVPSISLPSISLDSPSITIPLRLAVAIGDHDDSSTLRPFGYHPELLTAATKLVHLPTFGFTESLSLSVGAALIMNHLVHLCPEARSELPQEEKIELRKKFLNYLSTNDKQREAYAHFIENPPPVLDDLRKPEESRINYAPKKMMERIKKKEELVALEVEMEKPTAAVPPGGGGGTAAVPPGEGGGGGGGSKSQ